jgi:hypothetical protein
MMEPHSCGRIGIRPIGEFEASLHPRDETSPARKLCVFEPEILHAIVVTAARDSESSVLYLHALGAIVLEELGLKLSDW